MTTMPMIMLMLLAINLAEITAATTKTKAATTTTSDKPSLSPHNYDEFLRTETKLIDTLRDYIDRTEQKLSVIKRKTTQIKSIHDVALNDTDKYLNNPINALTILKRFATDWNALQELANNILNNNDEISKDISATKVSLKFPSEDDFDEALASLLRIQDIYKLEPQHLSLGELNGVKFGPEMSWSDCLEIGRKSDQNGDYAIAKFWAEIALEKLPTVSVARAQSDNSASSNSSSSSGSMESNSDGSGSEIVKARFEILQVLLNTEFHMGNYETALDIAKEMELLKPKHKGVMKAKETIEKTLRKETKRAKNKRTSKAQKLEQQTKLSKSASKATLLEEICRTSVIAPYQTTSVDSNKKKCYLETANLVELKLQPIKIEILSFDPYIVLQHDVLSSKEYNDLKNLIDEKNVESANDDEDDEDAYTPAEFTKLAKEKLLRINRRLQRNTGHSSTAFDTWSPERYSFEDEVTLSDADTDTVATIATVRQQKIVANVFLNLQTAKLGGAIVFPQLELSLHILNGALLYWSNLNEFNEVDYRVKHHVCPVISGELIAAVTTIQLA